MKAVIIEINHSNHRGCLLDSKKDTYISFNQYNFDDEKIKTLKVYDQIEYSITDNVNKIIYISKIFSKNEIIELHNKKLFKHLLIWIISFSIIFLCLIYLFRDFNVLQGLGYNPATQLETILSYITLFALIIFIIEFFYLFYLIIIRLNLQKD